MYDTYAISGVAILSTLLLQDVAFAWLYGINNLNNNLFEMIGRKIDPRRRPWSFFGTCWKWIIPALCSLVLISQITSLRKPSYNLPSGDYEYPTSGIVVAAMMTMSSLICIPIYAFKKFFESFLRLGSFKRALQHLTTPVLADDHPSRYLNWNLYQLQARVRIRSFRIRYIFGKIRNKPFLRIRYI